MLTEADYPLPAEFEAAYDQADALILEVDLGNLTGSRFNHYLLSKMQLKNTTLKALISAQNYRQLVVLFSHYGVPEATVNQTVPGILTMQLSQLELKKLGFTAQGIDQYFYQQALRDEKPIGALETAHFQIDLMANLGQGQEDQLITDTLADLDEMTSIEKPMRIAWRAGDMDQLNTLLVDDFRSHSPTTYKTMLSDRNADWLPKFERYIATDPVELVLVGAAHLVGDDGMLAQLKHRGYTVEPFTLASE